MVVKRQKWTATYFAATDYWVLHRDECQCRAPEFCAIGPALPTDDDVRELLYPFIQAMRLREGGCTNTNWPSRDGDLAYIEAFTEWLLTYHEVKRKRLRGPHQRRGIAKGCPPVHPSQWGGAYRR